MFFAFVVLGTAMLVAQDRDQIQDRDRDQLMMVDGEVLQIRDQEQIRLREPITLNDGTVIHPDGTYTTRDQQRLRLKDGECLDNNGILYRNEYQYRYKVQQENKGLAENQVRARNQNRFQVMVIDGEAYQIRNEIQNQIRNQYDVGDGTVVNPDGTYMTKKQERLKLQEGECINMEGAKFMNMYQNRKMLINKNMHMKKVNKKVKKPTLK
jgi:uncharacterized protein YxjI